MLYLTLIQLVYLGYAEFFETSKAKTLEILNEAIFVLIQYCFVLLVNLVWPTEAREQIGNVIIGLSSLLLLINLAVIVIVSVRAISRKCYLNSLKRKAVKDRKKKYLEAVRTS